VVSANPESWSVSRIFTSVSKAWWGALTIGAQNHNVAVRGAQAHEGQDAGSVHSFVGRFACMGDGDLKVQFAGAFAKMAAGRLLGVRLRPNKKGPEPRPRVSTTGLDDRILPERPVTYPVPVCRNGQTGIKSGGTLRQYGYPGSGAFMLPL
jgi:hypothetical protein